MGPLRMADGCTATSPCTAANLEASFGRWRRFIVRPTVRATHFPFPSRKSLVRRNALHRRARCRDAAPHPGEQQHDVAKHRPHRIVRLAGLAVRGGVGESGALACIWFHVYGRART
jgi:hypothetical protein